MRPRTMACELVQLEEQSLQHDLGVVEYHMADFDRAMALSGDELMRLDAASCAFLSGDTELFRRMTREGLARVQHAEADVPADVACQWARAACLAPGIVDDFTVPLQLAKRSWEEDQKTPALLFVLYRMENYES